MTPVSVACGVRDVPFFTVVIPVFNRRTLLERALRSVLAQTWQDFEIIVVDDGSTDDPGAAIAQLGDDRIRLLVQDRRGGNAARNLGIERAHGVFVALLDSDDQFLDHHLQAMRDLLEDEEVHVAGYAPVRVHRGEEINYVKPKRALSSGEEMACYLLCDRGYVSTSTTVVRTETAKRVRYDEQLSFGQDVDFAIRLWLNGVRFKMAGQAGAIWEDTARPDRVSAGRKGVLLIDWLERLRPVISRKAYLGYRGWAIAKGLAGRQPATALKYYLAALFHGCYRPRLAVVVFAQIFVSDRMYRAAANSVIRWRNRRPSPPTTLAAEQTA